MKDLPKETEVKIVKALEQAVKLANSGETPDAALIKVATEAKFTPQIVQRMVEAFNISKTLSHLKKAAADARADSFPLADAATIIGTIWPQQPETEATKAAQLLHTDYLTVKSLTKAAAAPIPAMSVKPYPKDPNAAVKKASREHSKLLELYKQAGSAYREVFFKIYDQVDKAAAYWRQVAPAVSFEETEKRAYARYGPAGKTFMDLVYTVGKLDSKPLMVKRAVELPATQMTFDSSRPPFDIIEGAIFLSGQLVKLAKAVNTIEASLNEHAICNIDKLPPFMVEHAIDYFLPKEAKDMPHFTEQDRPEKVKDIYRALKREHPDMSAEMKARIAARQGKRGKHPDMSTEMKARIAARQGKRGKQKQGPPYEAPLSTEKKSAALDSLF
jgi:hypothetical protein